MEIITFNPICGKSSEILYSNPCVIELHEKYMVANSEFGYSCADEDDKMPHTDIIVEDLSIYLKKDISCVEWAYSSDEEVWFFQILCAGKSFFWNVENKELAKRIVEEIKNWLIK